MIPASFPEPESKEAILRSSALTSECGHMVTPQQVSVQALKAYPPVWNFAKPFQFGGRFPHELWEKEGMKVWKGWGIVGPSSVKPHASRTRNRASGAQPVEGRSQESAEAN